MPKITDLTASSTITSDDVLLLVDDPSGTPTAKKVTAAVAKAFFAQTSYDIRDYGAVGDGTTDNTTAIQAAIDAATSAGVNTPELQYNDTTARYKGGGIVFVPTGVFLTGALTLGNRVHLVGTGWGSILKAKTNIGGPVITNAAHANMCAVRNLRIDGNKANQSTGSNRHGILWSNNLTYNNALDEDFDGLFFVEDVFAWRCKESGFVTDGRQGSYFIRCKSYFCDNHGFDFGQDTVAVGCETGWSGQEGFYLQGSGGAIFACKGWYSGQVTAGNGYGFHVFYINNAQLVGCQGQDNNAGGIFLEGSTGVTISGFSADSNSTSSAGGYAGIEVWESSKCRIDGVSMDNARATNKQGYAVRLRSNSLANTIALGSTGNTVSHVSTDSTSLGNSIAINGSDSGYQAPAFSATLTPDPYAGGVYAPGALTGNLTVAAPAQGHKGQVLTFLFVQDATGTRTVTFNSVFKKAGGAFTASTGNAAKCSIGFVYDGTSWLETSRALALA